MDSIAVRVHTTVEHGGSILADTLAYHDLSPLMIFNEIGNIVDDNGDSDDIAALPSLFNMIIPFLDWQLIQRNLPV